MKDALIPEGLLDVFNTEVTQRGDSRTGGDRLRHVM
jgi:hypothetical protein